MRLIITSCTVLGLFSALPAQAQDMQVFNCPGPLFECVPPGPPSGPLPGTPPGGTFRPVVPYVAGDLDYNRHFGVVADGKLMVTAGAVTLTPDMEAYLASHRDRLDPNAIYVLSPTAVTQPELQGQALIVGGGALAQ